MKTDEQIAKELYTESYQVSEKIGCIAGIQSGRELSDEKALRFAEWLGVCGYKWCESDDCYYKSNGLLCTVKELYVSKEFNFYYNSLKK